MLTAQKGLKNMFHLYFHIILNCNIVTFFTFNCLLWERLDVLIEKGSLICSNIFQFFLMIQDAYNIEVIWLGCPM